MNILKKAAEVSFELEQITLMIHFQGMENGAGIRASDLKPRFDAFLSKYKNNLAKYILTQSKDSSKEKDNKPAFDYKIKIINKDKRESERGSISYGAFYGGLKGKAAGLSFSSIEIVFISAHEELRKSIKEYFPIFLSVNGFGVRKNKGYGYFKIKNKRYEDIVEDIKKYKALEDENIGVYKVESNATRVEDILNEISAFHRILKSGYNQKTYIPSLMLKYYKKFLANKDSGEITFEKKAFKLFLKDKGYDISNLTIKSDDIAKNEGFKDIEGNIYYVRGILGLTLSYSFRDLGKIGSHNHQQKKLTVGLSTKIKDVERFASPIIYVPFPEQSCFIIIVDYGKIKKFREKAKNVRFSIKEGSMNAIIPTEKEYSIHDIFKKNGILTKFLDKYKDEIKEVGKNKAYIWKYSVISDVNKVDK